MTPITTPALPSNRNLPPSLLLFFTKPDYTNDNIVSTIKRHLWAHIAVLSLPDIAQRKQYRDASNHDACIVHCSRVDGLGVREHVDDVENDDVGGCDAEYDRTPRTGNVELAAVSISLVMHKWRE